MGKLIHRLARWLGRRLLIWSVTVDDLFRWHDEPPFQRACAMYSMLDLKASGNGVGQCNLIAMREAIDAYRLALMEQEERHLALFKGETRGQA